MISEALKSTASKIAGFGVNMLRASFGLGSPTSKPERKKTGDVGGEVGAVSSEHMEMANDVLGMIYRELVRARDDEKLTEDLQKSIEEEKQLEEEKKHAEILKALGLKRKTKKKTKKEPKEEPTKKETTKETTKETPKTTTKKETSTTPTTTAPSKTATTVPKTTVTSTAAKVATGVVVGATMASAIAASESAGNYDISFGDRFDKKSGKNVNSYGLLTPEQFLSKPLTEFTLDEVQQFQAKRNSQKKGTGAVGAYQFMPTTLFGYKDKKGNQVPGLVQQLKLPMSTKFNKETQQKLYEALHNQDVATLKRLGVPITPGYEYMAHYIGAGGASIVYRAVQAGQDITVAQALENAGKSVGANPELYKIRVKDFEGILADRLAKKGGLAPHSAGQIEEVPDVNTGARTDNVSKQNKELKDTMQTKQVSSVNNTTIINKSGDSETIPSGEPVKDRPLYQQKARR